MGADDNAAPAVASSKPSKDVVYGKVKVSAKTVYAGLSHTTVFLDHSITC